MFNAAFAGTFRDLMVDVLAREMASTRRGLRVTASNRTPIRGTPTLRRAVYARRFSETLEMIRAMPVEHLLEPVIVGGVAEQSRQAFPAFLYLLWAHNHIVHHRGQLSAYLRPMGARVPSIHGATGDAEA